MYTRTCAEFMQSIHFFLSFQGAVAGPSHTHTHTHSMQSIHFFFLFRGCCAVAGLSWFVFIMFYSVIYFDPKFEELIARFESIVSVCVCVRVCVCVCVCTYTQI